MASLITVQNDGPDAAEIRVGRRSVLLQPGGSYRVATTALVDIVALPKIGADDLALHMGQSKGSQEKYRIVTEDD